MRKIGTTACKDTTGSTTTYSIGTDASNYTAIGTYDFTRHAHDATCNTSWVASTGTYTLTVAPPASPTSFYTCRSLTWSNALRNADGCSGVSSLSTDRQPPAQYLLSNSSSYGYYYNWTCVHDYASTLCPLPCRVPTKSDFEYLIGCTSTIALANAWRLPGYVIGSNIYSEGGLYVEGYYWSFTEYSIHQAYGLSYMGVVSGIPPVHQWEKSDVYQVRCVK
ncbi:MAG: hypothetical protein LBD91_05995 [Prevotellaceae bacterium]|nr:hypothetical protein [Prevotellaceae bacterium]